MKRNVWGDSSNNSTCVGVGGGKKKDQTLNMGRGKWIRYGGVETLVSSDVARFAAKHNGAYGVVQKERKRSARCKPDYVQKGDKLKRHRYGETTCVRDPDRRTLKKNVMGARKLGKKEGE